jgi:hypothetical protein
MDFDLTEEQRRIRETLTDFAEREIKPHSTKWDKEETFPRHIVEQLGQLGFLGVAFPEKFGGGGAVALRRVDRPHLRRAHVALDRAHRGIRIRRSARSLRSRHAAGEEDRRVVPD